MLFNVYYTLFTHYLHTIYTLFTQTLTLFTHVLTIFTHVLHIFTHDLSLFTHYYTKGVVKKRTTDSGIYLLKLLMTLIVALPSQSSSALSSCINAMSELPL